MLFLAFPGVDKILRMGDKKMAKKISTKVLCCLIVFIILMSTMPASVFALDNTVTATAQLRSLQNQEGTELRHDDGEVDSYASSGSDGYAVFFSNDGKLNVNGIRICGARYDDTTREFDVELWDENLKTLYTASYDYTDFFPESTPLDYSDLKWVTIDVPNIEVINNFYVVIFTYGGPWSWYKGAYELPALKGGIVIGRDFDTKSGNSFVVNKFPNNTIVDWPTNFNIQEDTDWMIRVVTSQGTSTSKMIYVDDDFFDDPINHKWNTIQEGIDDADSGDTIIVKSGRYPEHIVIDKLVMLKGEEYPTVDGKGIETVISIRTDGVHIDGLKVIRCDPARENMAAGIRVWANKCVINDCIISDHNIGLGTGGKDNVISNCKFNDNRISLVIHNGERNTVKKNHFTNGGIILDKAKNNLITSNIIGLDSRISIYNKSEYNTIEGNSLGAIDIVVSEWGPTSHNNKIYHNNIICNGCKCQAYDDGNNQWDNGYPSGGNYWSDYTGTDADGDGIGDTPYNIDGGTGTQDRYPFIQIISDGTNGVEDMREIIEEVEKLRDKSISKINRDVDNTATLQAKIGKEVYDKEEKNIVLNSLQHIQGLLMPGSGILEYFMQFAIFELIDKSFKHFDKEIAEELLNTQSRVDVGCRILHHERDIQDYAMYNTGQENRLVILTEPYESGSHIKKVPNELEIFRYDLHTGIFQFVEKIFRDGVGPDTNLNIETGDLNNDGFEDLLLISGRHIDIYFYDADTDKFDTSESIQVKAQHTMISDISIGDLDNKGHNELVILSRDFVVSPMSIDVYRFDGNQLNGPLTEPLEPDIATWYPHLVIGDVNNEDSHKNELLVMGSTNAILYHYTGTEFNEISKHALPILYAKDIAIGDIDNKKDAKNEFVVIEKGIFSDSIVPFRYNVNTREFDRLDSSQLENDVESVFKLEICDFTNTGSNNVITGSKNGIKSCHYEENLGELEYYLRNEYRDAFMDKEGGPEYHKVVEDINNQYASFENDIRTKDLTNYPTEEVLKYLKELNKNLISSSNGETSILVMDTAEKTSEIKKIGTVSQISALVDKTIEDSENNRKTINILGYTIAGSTVVKVVLFIKSSGASMIAEAFIYSTAMTGTKYLEQFEELSLHELLQYQSLMSLIALSSEVSVTNDAFQNAVDFALNPTINYIDITKLTLDSIEVNDNEDFGFNIGYANVSNNGDNPARVKIFVEISTHVPFEDMEIISVSSSKEYTEIPPNSESNISFMYVAPSMDKWTDDGRLIDYWAWVTATSLNSEIKTRGVKFNVCTEQLEKAITNTIGMEFVPIPAGEFEMGSPSDEAPRYENEGPVRHVKIEKAFYKGRYEVTQKQWRAKPTLISFIYGPINSGKTELINQIVPQLPADCSFLSD